MIIGTQNPEQIIIDALLKDGFIKKPPQKLIAENKRDVL
jgi:hypothetical protein